MRMLETDRVRGPRRVWLMIDSLIRHHGTLTCEWCGDNVQYAPRIDHANPRSNGGAVHDRANLVVCCESCNTAKGDKPLTIRQQHHLAAINASRVWNSDDWAAARRIAQYPTVTQRVNAAQVYAEFGWHE